MMLRTLLYNPAISSTNIGDEIIADAAKKQIDVILKQSFVVELSTHLPLSFYYLRYLKNSDFKFVLGSNLLKSTFFGFKRQWNITLRMTSFIGPCILVGAGWWQYNNTPNLYTKLLLKSVLSKKHIHSVRDNYTLEVLNNIGIHNVINTSCPTMWDLTPEHCSKVKKRKSNSVVFTLTDYNKDSINDKLLISILLNNYERVYFWPQGIGDFDYFNSLYKNNKKIVIVNTTLKDYDSILQLDDIEYIGTRLHGGIRALQKFRRTLIIGIDNRSFELQKSFNLPVLDRSKLNELETYINSDFTTVLDIPFDSINIWRDQFEISK